VGGQEIPLAFGTRHGRRFARAVPARSLQLHSDYSELEIELIQTQMAQKPKKKAYQSQNQILRTFAEDPLV
jgi:hypothetical protein